MGALTPQFLMDLESRMRVISSNAYNNLVNDLWWTKVAKKITMTGKKETFLWLLDTAQIRRTGRNGGNLEYSDIVSTKTEVEAENAAEGLKLKKEQLDDTDGGGVNLAAHWSRGIGAYAAYWPQRCVAEALKSNLTAYDDQPFWGTHPVNPWDEAAGTYNNVLTGNANGIYPGKVPIDESVSAEVALQNLSKIIAYVASFRMPNGSDPRKLRLAYLFVPPRLFARAVQLTNAKFLAQMATSGAGTGDVEAVIRSMNFGLPIQIDEIGSSFGGSDTDYYVGMEDLLSDELGGFLYAEREPFSVNYYGPQTDVELGRRREYEWLTEGRNACRTGHPYMFLKCRST
jgi:Mu-like prophage major head subunit gpT